MAAVEASVVHHLSGPGPALLGRLEHEGDGARQTAVASDPGKHPRRPDENRGVTIMAAGVHHAVVLRAVLQVVYLLDGQRVHIRPQADGGGVPARQVPEHARAAGETRLDLDAGFPELLLDDRTRSFFLVRELRVGVQVVTDRHEVAELFADQIV